MLHRRVAELMADLGVAREEALEAEIRAAAAQVLADDTASVSVYLFHSFGFEAFCLVRIF